MAYLKVKMSISDPRSGTRNSRVHNLLVREIKEPIAIIDIQNVDYKPDT